MVHRSSYAFRIFSECTKKFYFKNKHNDTDITEAVLGFYKPAVDQAMDDDVLCFYSDARNKHDELYYPEQHFVTKRIIMPYLTEEPGNRYTCKIKDLQRYDLKKVFKDLKI